MVTDPMSSYDYDHVSTNLGPGASIQQAFANAGRAVRKAFGIDSSPLTQPEEKHQKGNNVEAKDGKEMKDEATTTA